MSRHHYTPAGWVEESDDALKAKVFEPEEAEKTIEEAIERLGQESPNFGPHTVTRDSLLTEIVVSLAWDYGAQITGMYNDMWSAVAAQAEDGRSVWVECYDLLAGAAMVHKLIAENYEARAR